MTADAVSSSERYSLRRYARAEIGAPLSPVEQVQAAEDALSVAMLRRDRSAFESLLAEGASLLVCKRMLRGKRTIMRTLRSYFEGRYDSLCCEASRIEVLDSGAVAFANGALLDGPGGNPVGPFESIWRCESDRVWRIAFARGSDMRVVASCKASEVR